MQLFQLLTCDWLLETRTALWELEHMNMEDDGFYQVPGEVLEKFQTDLNSLRNIVENIPVYANPWTRPAERLLSSSVSCPLRMLLMKGTKTVRN